MDCCSQLRVRVPTARSTPHVRSHSVQETSCVRGWLHRIMISIRVNQGEVCCNGKQEYWYGCCLLCCLTLFVPSVRCLQVYFLGMQSDWWKARLYKFSLTVIVHTTKLSPPGLTYGVRQCFCPRCGSLFTPNTSSGKVRRRRGKRRRRKEEWLHKPLGKCKSYVVSG